MTDESFGKSTELLGVTAWTDSCVRPSFVAVVGVALGGDDLARLVQKLGPVGELLLVRPAHVDPHEAIEVLSHAVDDALAPGRLVRIRRNRPRAEEARELGEERQRCPIAGKDHAGLFVRDHRLGVAGAAVHAANLDEERRGAAGVDLLGADVIERATGRLAVELPDVNAPAFGALGVRGWQEKYDPQTCVWGSFVCPRAPSKLHSFMARMPRTISSLSAYGAMGASVDIAM